MKNHFIFSLYFKARGPDAKNHKPLRIFFFYHTKSRPKKFIATWEAFLRKNVNSSKASIEFWFFLWRFIFNEISVVKVKMIKCCQVPYNSTLFLMRNGPQQGSLGHWPTTWGPEAKITLLFSTGFSESLVSGCSEPHLEPEANGKWRWRKPTLIAFLHALRILRVLGSSTPGVPEPLWGPQCPGALGTPREPHPMPFST